MNTLFLVIEIDVLSIKYFDLNLGYYGVKPYLMFCWDSIIELNSHISKHLFICKTVTCFPIFFDDHDCYINIWIVERCQMIY